MDSAVSPLARGHRTGTGNGVSAKFVAQLGSHWGNWTSPDVMGCEKIDIEVGKIIQINKILRVPATNQDAENQQNQMQKPNFLSTFLSLLSTLPSWQSPGRSIDGTFYAPFRGWTAVDSGPKCLTFQAIYEPLSTFSIGARPLRQLQRQCVHARVQRGTDGHVECSLTTSSLALPFDVPDVPESSDWAPSTCISFCSVSQGHGVSSRRLSVETNYRRPIVQFVRSRVEVRTSSLA